MLVLSRHPGQKVVFPELGISIEILRSSASVTKLGITAPMHIEVHREEIQSRKDTFVNDQSGTTDSGFQRRNRRDIKEKVH